MFSFTFFWAYTAFCQFMLQWYGNMPEETVWYKYRMFGEWQWVSIAMLVGFWAFPFVFLMSRWTKRIVPSLVFFAVWQLVFHWLDLYWNVMPSYDWQVVVPRRRAARAGPLIGQHAHHHVGFSAVDITVWLGLDRRAPRRHRPQPQGQPDPDQGSRRWRCRSPTRVCKETTMSGPKRNPDKLNTIGVVVVGICGAVLVYVTIVALQAFYMNDTAEMQTMADYGGNDTTARKAIKADEMRQHHRSRQPNTGSARRSASRSIRR